MFFWTILIVSFLVLILLYLHFGYKKVWTAVITYGVLASLVSLIFYFLLPGLFTQDLFALIIPYLFIIPFDRMMRTIAKYVIYDLKPVKYIVAMMNRILQVMAFAGLVLIIGLGLAVINMFTEGINGYNLASFIATTVIFLFLLSTIFAFLKKTSFTYILVVGTTNKVVYKLKTHKSRISVKKYLGSDVLVYARGMYEEHGEITYIYYTPEVKNVDQSIFEEYHSELFDYIKDSVNDHEALEEKYNEYLDQKNSIL